MANIPISSFTAAANTTGIGMSGFSLTGSNAQSIIDLAGTWNTSGTPTGVKLNVTDSASNAASLLMDLQVGGSTRFNVDKNGSLFAFQEFRVGNTRAAPNCIVSNQVYLKQSASDLGLYWSVTAGTGASVGALGFEAAQILAQRNGVNAQASRIYNTYTDASNYERGKFAWSSNVLQIGTEKAGTGTARNVELQFDSTTQITLKSGETVVGAGGSPIITLGHSLASTSARIGFNSGAQIVNSTINSVSAIRITNSGLTDTGGIQFGGTTSSFPAIKRSTTSLQARLADDSAFTNIQGKLTTETAYTAGAPTATGYIVLYDSAGTAYKVPAVAL